MSSDFFPAPPPGLVSDEGGLVGAHGGGSDLPRCYGGLSQLGVVVGGAVLLGLEGGLEGGDLIVGFHGTEWASGEVGVHMGSYKSINSHLSTNTTPFSTHSIIEVLRLTCCLRASDSNEEAATDGAPAAAEAFAIRLESTALSLCNSNT